MEAINTKQPIEPPESSPDSIKSLTSSCGAWLGLYLCPDLRVAWAIGMGFVTGGECILRTQAFQDSCYPHYTFVAIQTMLYLTPGPSWSELTLRLVILLIILLITLLIILLIILLLILLIVIPIT